MASEESSPHIHPIQMTMWKPQVAMATISKSFAVVNTIMEVKEVIELFSEGVGIPSIVAILYTMLKLS